MINIKRCHTTMNKLLLCVFKTTRFSVALTITLLCSFIIFQPLQASEAQAWQALSEGKAVALMRHAYAPDTNEISAYEPQRCEGERNLSKNGVEQAKKIAQIIRSKNIETMRVFSSSLCRCIDTGKAFEFEPVNKLALINSFFNDREKGPEQSDALRQWIIDAINNPEQPIMLVSHGLNVSALTGVYAEQGDVLILSEKDNELVVLHQFSTPW